MSEARDKFYELLAPHIEAKGYLYKKSKNQFVLTNGEAICTINFSWDGRGGTTYLNHINGEISFAYLAKALTAVTTLKGYPIFYKGTSGGHFDETIPQMYSKELFALTRDMAFKKMAAMSFEEKYPLVNIQRTVDKVKEIIFSEILPVHKEMAFEEKILNLKIERLLARLNELDTHNIMWDILIIKIMSKKMKIEEPQFVKDIKIFTNQSMDDLWNMQLYEFEKMEDKFNKLKF
jgi:hypothetical protein